MFVVGTKLFGIISTHAPLDVLRAVHQVENKVGNKMNHILAPYARTR